MRMRRGILLRLAVVILVLATASPHSLFGQTDSVPTPDQNTSKAKKILDQLIDALGGQVYLNVHARECDGRRAQFGHNGELTGYIDFKDYWRYPDQHRTEYSKKGNVADVFSGDHGWTLDRSGVSPEPESAVAEFKESLQRSVDNLLRRRLKENGLNINYSGTDVIDMKQVDWVDVADRTRTIRLAVERSSHLLLRNVVIGQDETTGERTQDTTVYANYHAKDGVMLPLQITREHDGRKIFQAFYDDCKINPTLPEDLFTQASLEKRFSAVGSKKDKERYKNARD
ncbi:MAG: hypothetical protein NVS9B4_14210 [Candidatus Acidiferrum sp.]